MYYLYIHISASTIIKWKDSVIPQEGVIHLGWVVDLIYPTQRAVGSNFYSTKIPKKNKNDNTSIILFLNYVNLHLYPSCEEW